MAVGLRVRNNNNIIQIDNQYKNLAMTQKGTVTTVAGVIPQFNSNVAYATITVSGTNPQIALIPTEAAVASLWYISKSGSSFVFHIVSRAAATIPYYIFDNTISGIAGAKLKMRDAAGNLFFDSSNKYLKIVGMLNTTDDDPVIQLATPSGRQCAVLVSAGGYSYVNVVTGYIPPSLYQKAELMKIAACAINVASNYASGGPMDLFTRFYIEDSPTTPQGIAYGTNFAQFPVIDVTHY